MATLNHKQQLFVGRPCWLPPAIRVNEKEKEEKSFLIPFEIQSVCALFSGDLLVWPFVFFSFWNRARQVCSTLRTCTLNVQLKVIYIRVLVKLFILLLSLNQSTVVWIVWGLLKQILQFTIALPFSVSLSYYASQVDIKKCNLFHIEAII